jgi:hypothetical protein
VPDRVHPDSPCPDLADLLLASEGELPKRRQTEVAAHLRQCAACREQLGSVGLAMREYQDAEPRSSAAFADATADRLDQFRTRLQQERRAQVAREIRLPVLPVRRWLPVAAAVPVLVAALFFSDRYSSVVRAEEFLTRAAAQEQSAPVGTVRRLQFHVRRTASRGPAQGRGGVGPVLTSSGGDQWSFTRDVGASNVASTASASVPAEELGALLQASHFDWSDPLSVRGFRTWRESLSTKTDSVTPIGGDALALRTVASTGVLRSAELIVRRVDFQPLKQTLSFEGFGDVEIVEVSRWVVGARTVADQSASPAPIVGSSDPGAEADALDEAELDVRSTLHRLALDWNPAIAVERSGRAIEVRGHIDASHKAQIARALSGHGLVHLKLRADNDPSSRSTATAAPVAPASGEPGSVSALTAEALSAPRVDGAPRPDDLPRITPTLSQPPLHRWLERTFGQDERASTFLAALEADAQQVRRRAAAFAVLAARYQENDTRRLTGPARKKLETLADAQYRDLTNAVETLDDRLALFLGTATRRATGPSVGRPWQPSAKAIDARAERLDQAIQELLRVDDLPLPTEIGTGHAEPPTLVRLRAATDALWDQLVSSISPST